MRIKVEIIMDTEECSNSEIEDAMKESIFNIDPNAEFKNFSIKEI